MIPKRYFMVFAIVLFVVFSVISISSNGGFYADINSGKNIVRINLTEPIYAETLIKLNPDIEAISYIDGNNTVGYVNFLGGVGRNFLIEDREYEIISSKNTRLTLMA